MSTFLKLFIYFVVSRITPELAMRSQSLKKMRQTQEFLHFTRFLFRKNECIFLAFTRVLKLELNFTLLTYVKIYEQTFNAGKIIRIIYSITYQLNGS